MKSYVKLLSMMILVVLLFTGMVLGQSLEERLQTMAAKNAEMYINPLVTAFGSGLNSGWFHSAKPHKLLGFDFGVRAMAVTFPDDQKTFNFDVSELEYSDQVSITGVGTYDISLAGEDIYPDREVPTFFGESDGGTINPASESSIVGMIEQQLLDQGVQQTILDQTVVQDNLSSIAGSVPAITMPPGTGLAALPLIVPQAAVGLSLPMLPIKAEVVVRGLPEMEISEELGSFQFFGGGAKLALDPFIPIPMFPVNIAVGAFAQKMSVGDVLESNNSLMSLMVGKDLNLMLFGVGVYGAVGLESTNMKIKYTYENGADPNDVLNGTEIKFDLKGDNNVRTTVGGRIRLAIFNISADYSMGADNVFTVGAGISIR